MTVQSQRLDRDLAAGWILSEPVDAVLDAGLALCIAVASVSSSDCSVLTCTAFPGAFRVALGASQSSEREAISSFVAGRPVWAAATFRAPSVSSLTCQRGGGSFSASAR